MHAPLKLTRQQILAFRRRVGGLEERVAAGAGVVGAGGVGRPPGQHAAGGAALAARARRRGRAVDVGRSVARPSCGGRGTTPTSSPKRDFALFSLGRLPDDAKGRRRAEEMAERVHAHLGGRTADRPRGRRRARRRQRDQVRRDDRHRRDPLGRRPGAGRLDRRRRRHRSRPTPAASSPGATSTFSGRRPRKSSRAGQVSPGARRPPRSPRSKDRSWRSARRSATSGCWQTTSRRCAPREASDAARAPAAERRRLLPARRGRAGAARPVRGAARAALDARGSGRARSSSTARSAAPGGAPTRSCGSSAWTKLSPAAARRGRGRGAQPAAPRSRAGDRRRLGDVTDTNICSIVTHGRRVPRGALPHGAEPRQGDAVRVVAEPVHGLRPPLHVLLRPRLRAAGRPPRRRPLRAHDPRQAEHRRRPPRASSRAARGRARR